MPRYIDAEIAKEILSSHEDRRGYLIGDFEQIIDEEVPTSDVVERKMGKWIVIMNEPNIAFDECKCSECGVVEYFNKGWKKFNFCPNCGAEMESE